MTFRGVKAFVVERADPQVELHVEAEIDTVLSGESFPELSGQLVEK
jgi:hypothetical protein